MHSRLDDVLVGLGGPVVGVEDPVRHEGDEA